MMNKAYKTLIQKNKEWALHKKQTSPEYFSKIQLPQKPPFLYIGCSDSRMPLDTYTQTEPGELFVHRNIANQVSLTDINFLSVLEYAVNVLKVKHIIVCGHYQCGGVEAAYLNQTGGLVGNWVNPIRDLVLKFEDELNAITNQTERLNRLAELNVAKQVENLFKTTVVQRALDENPGQFQIHGWVLDIGSGLIIELELPYERWLRKGIVKETWLVNP
jgi:carbonic anhydrase